MSALPTSKTKVSRPKAFVFQSNNNSFLKCNDSKNNQNKVTLLNTNETNYNFKTI